MAMDGSHIMTKKLSGSDGWRLEDSGTPGATAR